VIYFKHDKGHEIRIERAGFGIHVEKIAINIRTADGVGLSVWLEPGEAVVLARAVWTEADLIKKQRDEKPKKRKRRNA
jgi:hypothetical protein